METKTTFPPSMTQEDVAAPKFAGYVVLAETSLSPWTLTGLDKIRRVGSILDFFPTVGAYELTRGRVLERIDTDIMDTARAEFKAWGKTAQRPSDYADGEDPYEPGPFSVPVIDACKYEPMNTPRWFLHVNSQAGTIIVALIIAVAVFVAWAST